MPTAPVTAGAPVPTSIRACHGFLVFWASRIVTTLAYQMQVVAVGWQMYQLTGDPLDLGLIGLVQFLPSIVLMLVVGHVADRYSRTRIILLARAVVALAMLALAIATLRGHASRELLFGFVLVLGAVRAFEMPTAQALVPNLVPVTLLSRAIAWATSGNQAATIVGPAVGGFLYVAGPGMVYLLCAAGFAAGALVMAGVRPLARGTVPPGRSRVDAAHLLAGIRFIFANKALLGVVSLDLFVVLLGGATALLPVVASEILQVGPWGLGLLRSAPAVGALLVALWLARFPVERRAGPLMFGSASVFGAAIVVFGLSTSMALSLVALFVLGAADMVNVVIRQSIVQLETPDSMRGRVSAVNSVFIGASNQLGEFESGVTAAWWGTVPAIIVGGCGTLLVAVGWMRLFPQLRHRDQLHPED